MKDLLPTKKEDSFKPVFKMEEKESKKKEKKLERKKIKKLK